MLAADSDQPLGQIATGAVVVATASGRRPPGLSPVTSGFEPPFGRNGLFVTA